MPHPTRVCWITGAGGLIGHALALAAPRFLSPDWQVIPLTRSQLDLADGAAVRSRFKAQAPSLILHCAAMSRSPECQAQPAQAFCQNVEVTLRLSQEADGIPFFFFSTDLVFDGRAGSYVETDPVNPLSVYAETKVRAEAGVLTNPRHTVVRTSLNGGVSPTGDRGFNEQTYQAWKAGRTLKFFVDEFRGPIAAPVTAAAVWELVLAGGTGLFHLAGTERLSRWEIGSLLARRHPEFNPQLEPGSFKDYAGPPRPADTFLNCDKIQNLLSFPLPGLRHWLESHPAEFF